MSKQVRQILASIVVDAREQKLDTTIDRILKEFHSLIMKWLPLGFFFS